MPKFTPFSVSVWPDDEGPFGLCCAEITGASNVNWRLADAVPTSALTSAFKPWMPPEPIAAEHFNVVPVTQDTVTHDD